MKISVVGKHFESTPQTLHEQVTLMARPVTPGPCEAADPASLKIYIRTLLRPPGVSFS